METFGVTVLSILMGAIGYLAVTFWFQPILRYKAIKFEVAVDLKYFANAIELQKNDGEFRPDALERKSSNRKHAADLAGIFPELPFWYRCWLKIVGEDPLAASRDLFGLSNSSKHDENTESYLAGIRTKLRLTA